MPLSLTVSHRVIAPLLPASSPRRTRPPPLFTIPKLLEAGANPNVRMVSTNVSPLEMVVSHEKVATNPVLGPRLVRALIGAGVDVHGTGPQGRTALHHACHEGACGEVVQALLDAGADACAPCAGVRFLTPLQLAGCGGNPGALRVMINRPECGGLNAFGAPPERCGNIKCECGSAMPNPIAAKSGVVGT